jgi:hypothetical protein
VLSKFSNPFANNVQAQYSDGRFADLHVPELGAPARQQLFDVIETYRVAEYSSSYHLRPSRVITITGARGTGKTHLLDSIQFRDDGKPQMLIRRDTDGAADLSFEEQLFQLFLQGLLETQPQGFRYFDLLAAHLSRLLLVQTIRSLTPLEKLLALAPRRSTPWLKLLYVGGGEAVIERFHRLAEELERPDSSEDLSRLIEQMQLKAADLPALTLAHLARQEPGKDTLSAIRKEFYSALVKSALLGHKDAVDDFLEADYRPQSARFHNRDEVVRQLLLVLVEACALVRLPVVFAFDNLEGILRPAGVFNPQRTSAFYSNLAQVVDRLRGFLILVFEEVSFSTEKEKYIDRFALDRLRLGVDVPGRAPLDRIPLVPTGAAELTKLVKRRMARARSIFPDQEALPDSYPFSEEFLRGEGERTTTIRDKIAALQTEYNRVVLGKEVAGQVAAPPPQQLGTDVLFDRIWRDKLAEAERTLQASLSGNSQSLTRALGELAEAANPFPAPARTLKKVRALETVGDDPRYGFVSVLEFDCPGKAKGQTVAAGFLLAKGRGMAADLRAKLAALDDAAMAPICVDIFWPDDRSAADPASLFTGETLQAWIDGNSGRARVKKIELAELQSLLAFSLWREELRKQERTPPPESARAFAHKHFPRLLAQLQPPLTKE